MTSIRPGRGGRRVRLPEPLAGLPADATGFQRVATSDAESDGRRRRRLHNREAVVDALLDLYREGNLRPSTDEIAERAGLSPRSLFRYFDDVDDLADAAVARAQTRAAPLLAIAVAPDAPLGRRVTALVDQRLRLFDELGHAATVIRLRAPFQPVVARLLSQNRGYLREQLSRLFAKELGRLGRTTARRTLATLDVLASFETYDLLCHDQGMTPAQAKTAVSRAIEAVLAAAQAPPPRSQVGTSPPRR